MNGSTEQPRFANRPTGHIALSVAGAVVIGAGGGRVLAAILASGSELAGFVGVFVFPLCLGAGYAVWRGYIAAVVVPRAVRLLLTSSTRKEFGEGLLEGAPELIQRVMRMTVVFVPVSIVGGLIAGLIVAVVPGGRSAVLTVLVFTLAGTVYGVALRALARRGYLPFPDDV